MTSSARGAGGASFGWINRDLIASKKIQPHINVFGGEDRFWLGRRRPVLHLLCPGVKFDLEHWFTRRRSTPRHSKSSARLPTAWSAAARSISPIFPARGCNSRPRVKSASSAPPIPGRASAHVARGRFCGRLRIRQHNQEHGRDAWRKETGLLSIWILGMFNASPAATVVAPFKAGPESALGRWSTILISGKCRPTGWW